MTAMRYVLQRESTEAGVGFFAATPAVQLDPPRALAFLKAFPNDEFMRRFVLQMLGRLEPEEFYELASRALAQDPPPFQALLYEATLMSPELAQFRFLFEEAGDPASYAAYSPLPLIRAAHDPARDRHRQWLRLIAPNMTRHGAIPRAIASGLEPPFTAEDLAAATAAKVSLAEVFQASAQPIEPPAVETVAANALNGLNRIAAFHDVEQRHVQSLSPIALLRPWNMAVEVANGGLDYSLSGTQISYGKGLSLPVARASLYMEIVERTASFASLDSSGVVGRTADLPVIRAAYAELKTQGRAAVDPASLRLETSPPADAALQWLPAQDLDGREVLLPAQLVFLFANYDEPALTRGLDSTGLASGTSLNGARVSGLLEVLERDAEATVPYRPDRVFRPTSRDPEVATLLADYAAQGVHLYVQDLTGPFGVPCFKAFVVAEDGEIAKGTACGLRGSRAALSAILEVTWPYPKGPASVALDGEFPTRDMEDLPDFSSGHPDQDLANLGAMLRANGYEPLFVELTRKDVGIPVARAIVPGLEFAADFNAATRISPRLWANVQKLLG